MGEVRACTWSAITTWAAQVVTPAYDVPRPAACRGDGAQRAVCCSLPCTDCPRPDYRLAGSSAASMNAGHAYRRPRWAEGRCRCGSLAARRCRSRRRSWLMPVPRLLARASSVVLMLLPSLTVAEAGYSLAPHHWRLPLVCIYRQQSMWTLQGVCKHYVKPDRTMPDCTCLPCAHRHFTGRSQTPLRNAAVVTCTTAMHLIATTTGQEDHHAATTYSTEDPGPICDRQRDAGAGR